MKTRRGFNLLVRLALVVACALPLAGCNAISDAISGVKYRGPPPAEEDITNEVAIVRSVYVPESGRTSLLIDRVRYVQMGDPHNVNRAVEVSSGDAMLEAVAALKLVVGDSVLISTQYQGNVQVVNLQSVPNWPGHKAYQYPIALHVVTAIARTGS